MRERPAFVPTVDRVPPAAGGFQGGGREAEVHTGRVHWGQEPPRDIRDLWIVTDNPGRPTGLRAWDPIAKDFVSLTTSEE